MAEGIYIYAECFDDKAESYTAELVSAAKSLKSDEPITVFAIGKKTLSKELSWDDLHTIIIDGRDSNVFQEDLRSEVIAQFLNDHAPRIVLIPATPTAKSLFARVAVLLDVGLTADCTEIYMENGRFLQKKPAFGNNAMVITEERSNPAMVTLVTGIYPEEAPGTAIDMSVYKTEMKMSSVELSEIVEQQTKSVIHAEHVISLGRGAIVPEENFETATVLADKLGAAIGGTRPLVDCGMIPFEQQIGQTGSTIHPRTCIFFGVSGAIQHTEGVRDTDITIAVNSDPHAAIFSFADYGVIADAGEMMKALIAKLNEDKSEWM